MKDVKSVQLNVVLLDSFVEALIWSKDNRKIDVTDYSMPVILSVLSKRKGAVLLLEDGRFKIRRLIN